MTFAHLVDLAVNFLFAGDDGEIGDGGHGAEIDVHVGTEHVLINEREVVGVVEIDLRLAFHGHGLKDELDVVVFEELVNLLVNHTVDFHHEDVLTVHLLDDAHGGVALAEAGDGHLAALFLQRFIDIFSVICFLDFNGEFLDLAGNVFVLDIH